MRRVQREKEKREREEEEKEEEKKQKEEERERNTCVQTDFSLPSLFELGPIPWKGATTIAWPMSVIPLVLNLSRNSLTDTPRYPSVMLNPVRLTMKLPYQFHQ